MTDPVQRARGRVVDTLERSLLAYDVLLELPLDNIPQTVIVSSIKTPEGLAPCFQLTEGGPYSTKGIWWQYPTDQPEYAMFITFQLAPEIVKITGEVLWYSVVYGKQQQVCIPTGKAAYFFDVDLPGGLKLDPQIVVTPITNL